MCPANPRYFQFYIFNFQFGVSRRGVSRHQPEFARGGLRRVRAGNSGAELRRRRDTEGGGRALPRSGCALLTRGIFNFTFSTFNSAPRAAVSWYQPKFARGIFVLKFSVVVKNPSKKWSKTTWTARFWVCQNLYSPAIDCIVNDTGRF
jgi:hypothetical protein